jgi:hypothetical protein
MYSRLVLTIALLTCSHASAELKLGGGASLSQFERSYGHMAFEMSVGFRFVNWLGLSYSLIGENDSGPLRDTLIERSTTDTVNAGELEIQATDELSFSLYAGRASSRSKIEGQDFSGSPSFDRNAYGAGVTYRFMSGKMGDLAFSLKHLAMEGAKGSHAVGGTNYDISIPSSSTTYLFFQASTKLCRLEACK